MNCRVNQGEFKLQKPATLIVKPLSLPYFQCSKWELPKIRGPNVNPEKQDSHYKDTHKHAPPPPQFTEAAKQPTAYPNQAPQQSLTSPLMVSISP